MKTFSKILATCSGVVLLATSGAFAQGSNPLDPTEQKAKVLIGPVVGLSHNMHSGGFRTLAEENCPIFTEGSGTGFLAGITAEFQLGETFSIIPRATYQSRPGSFTQTLPDALVLLPGQNTPVTQSVTTNSEISYSLAILEVMYKQEFAELGPIRLGAAFGPTFGFVVGGDNYQTQDLIEPANARFVNPDGLPVENNGRTLIFNDGAIPERAGTRFSIKGGLQGEFGLFNDAWLMSPGIYYDYGLTDVTTAEAWQLNTIMFQVDFRRAF